MSSVGVPVESASATPSGSTEGQWRASTLAAFRLCVVYIGLYVLNTQMISTLVRLPIPPLGMITPVSAFFQWVGTTVLGIAEPIRTAPTGSGDRMFDWVQAFSLVLISIVAVVVWSLVDRRRLNYARLHTWFRVFVRFALGTTMVGYGASKLIPVQMPVVFLTRLVEPFGNFSPMGVLWTSIGAAPAYETFVGSAELLGGFLLFVPRTALLGALICLMNSIAVFTLNMTYDVPVKLFSFHLILLSLFLLAPNVRPLVDLVLLHRSARASAEIAPGKTPQSQRRWRIAQVVFGVFVVLQAIAGGVVNWTRFGGGAPKSPLFGIWDVAQMSIDGEVRPPLLTDRDRWRRVIFQAPTAVTFQRMDDSFERYGVTIDTSARTLAVTSIGPKAVSTLAFERPSPERLIVKGPLNGRTVHLELTLRDLNSFLLESRGFHLVQEVPFNR
ncbi:MAG TPA: hypothetical protein VKB50_16300 [Vicinamibacterales bacterium]|nr:hypothetical protein [Vicinamibacterales bacterium]